MIQKELENLSVDQKKNLKNKIIEIMECNDLPKNPLLIKTSEDDWVIKT